MHALLDVISEEKEIMRLVEVNHKIRTYKEYRNKLKTKV